MADISRRGNQEKQNGQHIIEMGTKWLTSQWKGNKMDDLSEEGELDGRHLREGKARWLTFQRKENKNAHFVSVGRRFLSQAKSPFWMKITWSVKAKHRKKGNVIFIVPNMSLQTSVAEQASVGVRDYLSRIVQLCGSWLCYGRVTLTCVMTQFHLGQWRLKTTNFSPACLAQFSWSTIQSRF